MTAAVVLVLLVVAVRWVILRRRRVNAREDLTTAFQPVITWRGPNRLRGSASVRLPRSVAVRPPTALLDALERTASTQVRTRGPQRSEDRRAALNEAPEHSHHETEGTEQ